MTATAGFAPVRVTYVLPEVHERLDRILPVAITVLTVVISMWNLSGAPGIQDDEGTYTAQAVAIQQGSLAPYTYWYDHPPLGWIQLALWSGPVQLFGLAGGTEIGTMRVVAGLHFAACAVLIYLIARRAKIHPVAAVLGTGLFVLSPLALTLGRQVYLDGIATPWLLLAFFLATSGRNRLAQQAGAGLAFAMATLSKITVTVFGPALLLALLDRTKRGRTRFPLVAFLATGGLAILFYPLMAALRGELASGPGHVSLQDALTYQFVSRSGSGSFWDPESARVAMVKEWIWRDPLILLIGLVGAVLCVSSQRTRWITLAIVSFASPVMFSTGYLPSMYIYVALPFLGVAWAAACDMVWRSVLRPLAKLNRWALPSVVLVLLTGLLALQATLNPGVGERYRTLFFASENDEWRSTINWVSANIDRHDVVLVPYAIWPDLHARGFNDPWQLIAFEKADLDSEFTLEHPQGWREIEWVVVNPMESRNIASLGLSTAGSAVDHSTLVKSFGDWEVRKVNPGG